MKRTFFTGLIFCFSFVQGQTYHFRHYTEDNGLDQNYVYSISQSDKGYLYCTTGQGMSVFDGFKFRVISNKRLYDNFVTTHFTDSRDVTWLGQNQNGISFLKNDSLFALNAPGLSDHKVVKIAEDKRYNIWVATAGGGFYKIGRDLRITRVTGSPDYISSFCFDKNGEILAATSEGLKLVGPRADGSWGERHISSLLADKNIRQVIPANSDLQQFWVLTSDNIVYGLTLQKDGAYKVFSALGDQLGLKSDISCIYADKGDNLWIGLAEGGACQLVFRGSVIRMKYAILRISKSNGFVLSNISSIYEDREGNIWFGSLGDGLVQKSAEKFSFFGTSEGLTDTEIKKVLAESGKIWVGSESGLGVYNRYTGAYSRFGAQHGFTGSHVSSLAFDSSGRLWIGTAEKGIYVMDTLKKKFVHFSQQHKLRSLTINNLSFFGNAIYAGTTEGLYVIHPDDEIEYLTTNEGLLHNNVLQVYGDRQKRLWIASHGAPPYYIKDGKAVPFKKVVGLDSYNINSYCEDARGNIWIATEGDGLFFYNNRQFVNYTAEQGLFSDYCNGVVADEAGNIWVTHRSGLSEKKHHRDYFNHYSEQNGLVMNENSLNGLSRDGDQLWFATSDGLVNFDLETTIMAEIRPKILLRSLLINDSVFDVKAHNVLKYGYYSVRLDFIAISLSEPGSIQYRYRLIGADTAWKSTTERSIDYAKLGDGAYTLEIVACNTNNGLCSELSRTTFKIKPPVWQSFLFYLLILAGVVFLTYSIILLRTRNLRRTQLLLQLKVKQKTFLLQREKEAVEAIKMELEEKNKDITDSISYAKRIQDSILPPEELLDELFDENYFVMFKPKDIVSGDIYWAASMNVNSNNKAPLAIAAVVDCTGHGVPGAFLSIMANDFLKQSIIDQDVNQPDEILNFLNEHVSSHLNQSKAKNQIRDGMDIALIGIDKARSKLYFSGANNPIYIFRRSGNEIDQIILTATKQAIGLVTEDTVRFAIREFTLQKGDTIYLFSDGYADQFGGENNKKLTYKRFREILCEAFELPLPEQGKLLATRFEEWKKNTPQTDDVCVMGIRF